MNLHQVVRGPIGAINPDIVGTLRRSTGYTTAPGGVRTPTYSNTTGRIQVQALSKSDLKHVNDLNLQQVDRKVYMYGDWGGPIRADQTGGDLLQFPLRGVMRTWKIVTVFETWGAPIGADGWSAVGVVLQ